MATIVVRLVAAAIGFAAAPGLAQTPDSLTRWPTRTVHVVVPSPSGSGIDLVARALAQRLAERWGEGVVVDNKPGANSIIGTDFVARSPPDGHTLLFASDSAFTVNPHLYARLPYDPMRDFVPITQFVTFYQLLVAHPSLGAHSLEEMVAIARSRPGSVTYASFGAGSSAHLLSEMLRRETDTDLLHVPYKGLAQSVAAVLSGESAMTWAGVFSTQPHVQAGRFTALAIAAPRRSPFLPDVPTMKELGYPAFDYVLWYGLFAPAGTPAPIVERIWRDVASLLADREFRDKELLARAYEPGGLAPDAFAAYLRRELAARASFVKLSGARVE